MQAVMIIDLAKLFRFSSIRGKPLLTILKYPGNFLLNCFLLHIFLSLVLAKTQACRSGKLLGRRPSQDLGSLKKDFCGIPGITRIRKHRITPKEIVLTQFPINLLSPAFCSLVLPLLQTWNCAESKLSIVQIRFKWAAELLRAGSEPSHLFFTHP